MTTIVQISDTHFGTEYPDIVAAAARAIERARPDIVILSGDITQRARRGQFAAAKRFLDALPGAVKLAIPGNHDLPLYNVAARFLSPYGNYRRDFGPREFAHSGDGFGIIGFDATSPYRHKDGRLATGHADRRLSAMRAALPAEALLIVAVHQPLATAWKEDRAQTLIDRHETAAVFARHRVDLVLSGHVHVPLLSTSRDRFPELGRHFILSNAGTATSWRTREGAPNSFNVIKLLPGNSVIALERLDHALEASEFLVEQEERFLQTADGWLRHRD